MTAVSLWYALWPTGSSQFADPLDIRPSTQTPIRISVFGGGGAHFRLGANLARREIRVAFDELRRQMPDVVATEEPARLSQFIHGIEDASYVVLKGRTWLGGYMVRHSGGCGICTRPQERCRPPTGGPVGTDRCRPVLGSGSSAQTTAVAEQDDVGETPCLA